MQVLVSIILVLVLTGCTAMRQPGEIAWQAAHLVDALQTDSLRDDPCLEESDPFTRALIGSEPSRGAVIAWAAGSAVVHAGITEWLLSREWNKLASAWQWITFGHKGIVVANNHRLGARVIGPNKMRCMQ